jgi:alcohol dehydrogenase class IV
MRFNLPDAHAAYAQIAADAFPHLGEIEAFEARANAFIEALAELCVRLGMPVRLRDVNIPESALATMASEAMKQQRLLVNNPRPVTEADALSIYRAAW